MHLAQGSATEWYPLIWRAHIVFTFSCCDLFPVVRSILLIVRWILSLVDWNRRDKIATASHIKSCCIAGDDSRNGGIKDVFKHYSELVDVILYLLSEAHIESTESTTATYGQQFNVIKEMLLLKLYSNVCSHDNVFTLSTQLCRLP